jgi:hypothetical protein
MNWGKNFKAKALGKYIARTDSNYHFRKHLHLYAWQLLIASILLNWLNNATRVTNSYRICRHIVCDNAASTNHCACADSDAWHNNSMAANPAIVAQSNGGNHLHAGSAFFGIDRMGGSVEMYRWPE